MALHSLAASFVCEDLWKEKKRCENRDTRKNKALIQKGIGGTIIVVQKLECIHRSCSSTVPSHSLAPIAEKSLLETA